MADVSLHPSNFPMLTYDQVNPEERRREHMMGMLSSLIGAGQGALKLANMPAALKGAQAAQAAETDLAKIKAKYPLLMMGGGAGNIGAMQYLLDNPKANQIPGQGEGQPSPQIQGGGMTGGGVSTMNGHARLPMAPEQLEKLRGIFGGQIPMSPDYGQQQPMQMPQGNMPRGVVSEALAQGAGGQGLYQPQQQQTQGLAQALMQRQMGQEQQQGGQPQMQQPQTYSDILNMQMNKPKQQGNPAATWGRILNSPSVQSLIQTNPEFAKLATNATIQIAQNAVGQVGGVPVKISQEDIQTMQANNADILSKKGTTAMIMNQRHYAEVLDNIMPMANDSMPAVTQYAGAGGKAKLFIDKMKASSGLGASPEYQQYITFTNQIAPLIGNEMRRTLGGQATDHEQKLISIVTNPASWDSDPQTAMKQWNTLITLFKYRANPALATRPSQVVKNLQSGANEPPKVSSSAQPINITPEMARAELERRRGK